MMITTVIHSARLHFSPIGGPQDPSATLVLETPREDQLPDKTNTYVALSVRDYPNLPTIIIDAEELVDAARLVANARKRVY